MTGPETSAAGPVVSPEQALEFVASASALLARSLDYETTLREVARLAVPDIADWCGVLLVDSGDGERELSSGYDDPALEAVLLEIRRRRREAADASESRRVAESGEPILASDVRATIDDNIEAGERELVERLAPKSYMIVPLAARGRALGSMTLLSTRAGRHYAESDLAFAAALAQRCALAIDNARLHDRAERSLSLLDTVFSTAPVGLALVDRDLRFVRVNETFAAFNDRPVEALVGRAVSELPGEDGLAQETVISCCRHVLATGEAALDRELTREAAGGLRHWNSSFTAVTEPGRIGCRRDRRRSSTSPSAVPCWTPSTTRACAPTSSRAPARSSTRRWTTRRRSAPSPRSRSPRSPTGAPSACSTTTGSCTRSPPRTSTTPSARSAVS